MDIKMLRQGYMIPNTANMDAEGVSGSKLQETAKLPWSLKNSFYCHCLRGSVALEIQESAPAEISSVLLFVKTFHFILE